MRISHRYRSRHTKERLGAGDGMAVVGAQLLVAQAQVESTWTFAFRKRDRDPVIIVSDESLAAQERGNELRISLVRLARLHTAVLRTTGSAEQAGDQDL